MTRYISTYLMCATATLFGIGCSVVASDDHSDRPNKDSTVQLCRVKADTSTIAFLPFDTSYYWIFEDYSKCRNTELSPQELDTVEALVQQCVTQYMNARTDQQDVAGSTTRKDPYRIARSGYVLQCIAVVNADGEKEVWVNALCDRSVDIKARWRKQIILVQDGGGCYYQLKVNLSKGTYRDLHVNGVA